MRFIVAVTVAVAVSGCYNEALPQRDLVQRQSTAIGWIKHRDCANHGAVYYGFEVNGQAQAGRAPPGVLDCSRVKVGDAVKVYYDRANPAMHTLLEPRHLYEQERGYYIPIWLSVPALLLLLLLFQYFTTLLEDAKRAKARPPE